MCQPTPQACVTDTETIYYDHSRPPEIPLTIIQQICIDHLVVMPRRKSPVVWSLSVKPQIASPKDDPLSTFLTACETGNETVALRLAGGCADDSLTVGLNKAMKNNRLELARNLINAGAQWNTETVHLASASFDAVRLLVETGFDVNTGLGEGTVLLLYVSTSFTGDYHLTQNL